MVRRPGSRARRGRDAGSRTCSGLCSASPQNTAVHRAGRCAAPSGPSCARQECETPGRHFSMFSTLPFRQPVAQPGLVRRHETCSWPLCSCASETCSTAHSIVPQVQLPSWAEQMWLTLSQELESSVVHTSQPRACGKATSMGTGEPIWRFWSRIWEARRKALPFCCKAGKPLVVGAGTDFRKRWRRFLLDGSLLCRTSRRPSTAATRGNPLAFNRTDW